MFDESTRRIIAERYADGVGFELLARQFECARTTIRRVVIEAGLTVREPGKGAGERVRIDVDEAVALYEQGTGLKTLATKYDTSAGVIRDRLVKAGVTIRKQGDRSYVLDDAALARDYLAGDTLEKLALRYCVNASTIAGHLRRMDVKPLSRSERVDQGIDWYEVGCRYEQDRTTLLERIAADLGVSPQTVQRRLIAIGVTIRDWGGYPGMATATRVELPVEEIAALYASGWSIERLAKRYGCAHQTIRYRLTGAGVTIRPQNRLGRRKGE